MINVNIYVYCTMILWDVMRTRWWLCSIMGSYGWSVVKIVYGETIIHSTEAVWEILAREEWLGYRHDASPMFDILRSTSMWAQYIIFYDFSQYKIYMYYVLKFICIIKKNIGGLWRCLGLTTFKECFDRP